MRLKDFIDNFVCRNSLIRLWTPIKGGHKLLCRDTSKGFEDVTMEWEILDGSSWQSIYKYNEVIGIKDILVDGFYREAINIVIKTEIKEKDSNMLELTFEEELRLKNMMGRVVRHFKGKDYLVMDVAEHTETGATLVIYKALYGDNLVYARPIKMFLSEVDRNKYPNVTQKYRLELKE